MSRDAFRNEEAAKPFDAVQCPKCGEQLFAITLERHSCDGVTEHDRTCDMCGEPFTDYLHHLKEECPARERDVSDSGR